MAMEWDGMGTDNGVFFFCEKGGGDFACEAIGANLGMGVCVVEVLSERLDLFSFFPKSRKTGEEGC